MGSVITRSEEFIQKNQKTIIIAVVAVLIVILAIFGLRRWYFQPREDRAASEMFAAEQWFAQGDFQKALDGDDTYRGFLAVADSYSGTKAGNLARYYAGICNLRLGNFDEAARWLKKYNGKDTFTRPLAKIALGDAEMELGNTKQAVDNYMKAANMEQNFVTAPTALFKAGMGYMILGDNTKALDCFKQVKQNYPESTEWSDIDKYIALAESAK
ncbi:MAG: tetratricopeptide repeat protein [Bacteroidales bacterium]|nr:tetratricopeptide repeat protein [Bacteroidales bacterium]